nr:PaaX family transcriptional regulator C-terminal domain-containing protein [Brevibacillus daliensis]
MLSNSTWISPHHVKPLVEDLIDHFAIEDCVELFSSSHLGQNPSRLVERCWNLEHVHAAYRQFIDDYEPRYIELHSEHKQPIDNWY